MQLTRIATTSAKKAGYKVVAHEGRLKSVIVWKIYEQLEAIKTMFERLFMVKFKDPAGHVFGRVTKMAMIHGDFQNKAAAEQDMAQYHSSAVAHEKHQTRTQAPGRLLDLAGLAAVLAPRGYASKEVLLIKNVRSTGGVIPRTEDKTVTPEQFNELLPLVDRIAKLVGVDTSLTHRQPRSSVKPQGSHGANRPGVNVPADVQSLKKYGDSAMAIYEVLAKNYLAMLAEDYVYDHVTADLADYQSFKTAFNVPIQLNFKLVYDSFAATRVDDDDEDENAGVLGPMADPYIYSWRRQQEATATHDEVDYGVLGKA